VTGVAEPRTDPRWRAEQLTRRRAEFLRRLPTRVRIARKLSADVRELVVDAAIEFTALRHSTPVPSTKDLERVFWDAALKRAQQAADGRHDTVRAGYTRADPDALEQLTDTHHEDPAAVVEAAVELALAREFAAELDEREQRVLRAKYDVGGAQEAGYKVVARTLGWPVSEVRKLEARIEHKRDRFATITAAGRLCAWRGPAIAALAAGQASAREAAIARAHLTGCPVCTVDYVRQLRYLRSGRFQERLGEMLPPLTAANERRARTGLRDLLADWIARLLGHDVPGGGLQLAAGGAGRGIGTAAALKLAALCAGASIGVCVSTGVLPLPAQQDTPRAEAEPRPQPTASPYEPEPPVPHGGARPTPTPTVKPTSRDTQTKRAARAASVTQGGTGPRDHEQRPAAPAPANSAPAGASEFDPGYQPSAPAVPAPVPAAPGASEFQ
jgi:hypothetical protein